MTTPIKTNKIIETLKSRKFWIMVLAVLGAVSGALAGELTWAQAIQAAIASLMTWVMAQGMVDAKKVTEKAEKIVPFLLVGVLVLMTGCATLVTRDRANYMDEIKLMQVANEKDQEVLRALVDHSKTIKDRDLCLAVAERLQVNQYGTKWRLMAMLRFADDEVDPGSATEIPPADELCPASDFVKVTPATTGDLR
jgi:hypothetical protein